MTIMYLGTGHPDTIISGVIMLVEMGMIPIAAVIFLASVAVPLLKLCSLFWLLLMLQCNWKMNARQCTQMYRMVKFIGRWSMLDLFVIAILVTLVNLGGIATITGGPAAGKTEVRYEGIQIGKVSRVIVQPDFTGIIATLEMDKRSEIGKRCAGLTYHLES